MKLEKAKFKGYKSIGNECELDLDIKSTCLVGKSNVGKSNILEVIVACFNDDPIDETNYCSWNMPKPDDEYISVTFSIEEKDREKLSDINPTLQDKNEII